MAHSKRRLMRQLGWNSKNDKQENKTHLKGIQRSIQYVQCSFTKLKCSNQSKKN